MTISNKPDIYVKPDATKMDTYVKHKGRRLMGVIVVGIVLVLVGAIVQLLFMSKYGPKWWGWAAMWSVGIILVLIPLFLLALLHERQRCVQLSIIPRS